jgi:hypothetical protein
MDISDDWNTRGLNYCAKSRSGLVIRHGNTDNVASRTLKPPDLAYGSRRIPRVSAGH